MASALMEEKSASKKQNEKVPAKQHPANISVKINCETADDADMIRVLRGGHEIDTTAKGAQDLRTTRRTNEEVALVQEIGSNGIEEQETIEEDEEEIVIRDLGPLRTVDDDRGVKSFSSFKQEKQVFGPINIWCFNNFESVYF